jgi:thiamine-phosphate pyrophosphorylase
MNLEKPFLYFVTPDIEGSLKKWLGIIQEVVLGGASLIQIRDKTSTKQQILQAAKAIHPFLRERNVPLIINDHLDIAKELGAEGIHLGQSDTKVQNARQLLGKEALIGVSIEHLSQVEASEGADYLGASPLFPTCSKQGLQHHFGIKGLIALRNVTSLPLVAIGGIRCEHVPDILRCGVQGIAVISAISKSPCPRSSARDFVSQLNRCKEPIAPTNQSN